ncbi:hypothetical protein ABB37_05665 [Leptomonas pyrrhocoris]|uniref:Uncharacterized protein n=1 Tax=Leptomonas pyrrhocoris TaxID=157538 RepID=A0A0N0DUM6_LEPPY|nr:hypothetical protein ABB37_05665 [Leptomonas pyrrhocoris]XP_015657601.1 hypothetical protein ABB37_05665 [Leptomonas pyrrhocoris]KPA79161.1 hypothetical protein ABB37_05665 [Leptomonas pyrrhocoris]KPA79162.1 hypothetical protein ABB37_05665 [Leptomonas pyrrhocoris]|eukprot:XP_015657600.1 hypothetical protein ABB37_05665 [Leptomonas pyrrhocoris]
MHVAPINETAFFSKSHHPILEEDSRGRCVPTPKQTLEAVQRYRSGCMSALTELHAIQRHVSAPSTRTHSAEVPQLQRNYRLLEARLSEALGVQAAYMKEVATQQRQRERDGVVGEYMWTTRLLVEQEAAERVHLGKLYDYVTSTAPLQLQNNHRDRGDKELRKDSTSANPPPTSSGFRTPTRTRRPPQGDGAVLRLTAEKEALLLELQQQSSRTETLLQAQMRDLQAAHARALAQMVARHEAERSVWETRSHETEKLVQELQQECACQQGELRRCHDQRREAQQYATITHDGLQQQLKDTTKKMWQLQLANDHLDAKARVLQRELEELRVGRSPIQARPTTPSRPPPSESLASLSENDALHRKEERPRATKPTPAACLIGVPAAARMTQATKTATSVPRISRLPDPPLRRTTDDVRHGDPLRRSNHEDGNRKAARDNTMAEEAEEGTVDPSVWLAYDARSLVSGTTPTRSDGRRYAWGEVRRASLPSFPVSNIPFAQRSSAVGDAAEADFSYMSEDPTGYASTEVHSHMSAMTAAAAAAATGDESQGSGVRYSPLPLSHTASAQRQLSLERTPVVVPPQRVPHSSHDESFINTATHDVEVDTDDDDNEPISSYEEEENEGEEGRVSPPRQASHPAQKLRRQQPPQFSSSGEADIEERGGGRGVPFTRSRSSPHMAPLAASTPPSSRSRANSDVGEGGEADDVCPPLTAPHGAVGNTSQGGRSSKGSETAAEEEDSSTVLPPSSSRAWLENARREVLQHMAALESEVQEVTARHDAAQRQRRRERDIIRVNATSLHTSPVAKKHGGDEEDGSGNASDVDCALEQLHIAQQEDDDELAQYYAEVNHKRGELERCLRVVGERLAPH